MQKLKCVIIGYGYMGEIRRAVVERTLDLELSGILDTDLSVKPKLPQVRHFESLEEVLKAKPDLVFVCTPNVFSPHICVRALSRGIHVFCEKPPGRNVTDIQNIRKAERNGVKLMFGFNHRWHPGIMKAKAVMDSGRFGRIINMRAVYGKSGGARFKHSWRNDPAISGGGILLDQGIHMLDLFRFFAGDFAQVKCVASNAFWNLDVEDNAFVVLKGRHGIDAMLHSSSTFWKHAFGIHITLEGGYLVVEGLLSKTGSYGREQLVVAKRQFEDEAHAVGNPSEEITYFDRDLSWDLEVQEFVKCIREDRPVTTSSSQDALKVMQIIEQAYLDAGWIKPQEVTHEEHCRQ